MKKSALSMALLFLIGLLSLGCQSNGGNAGSANNGIEAEYAAGGLNEITRTTISGFVMHYPLSMTGDHPIITWGNGTGASPSDYDDLLRHLASWGFVVIASENPNTGTGKEMLEGVDFLIDQNSTPGSTFYRMLNTDRIGATGHSQGAMGTVAVAADPKVTCSAPLAGAGYTGDVKGPLLLITGAQDITVPPATLSGSYEYSRVPTIFAIANGMNHLSFSMNGGNSRGYLTAWFMFHLKNDANAAQAFIDNCEMCHNGDWIMEKKNFD